MAHEHENEYLIGMDLGTTNMKAIIISGTGKMIASASRANDLIFPGPSQVEQNPNQWWSNAVSILKEITASVGMNVVNNIKGICVSSQTITMLPMDANGHPLRNAMIWMDSRSSHELDRILDAVGKEAFISIVGGQPDVAFLPSKLLWYKENEPELFNNTYRVLQASSYINYKLTGEMTMDLDQAVRSQCLDLKTLKWSETIAHALGMQLDVILPSPVQIDEIIGVVSRQAADETGLVPGIPVIAGASDAMASMYATGINGLAQAGESSGTTSLVFIGHESQSATDIPVVTKPCPIKSMPYVFDAPINTSGASIKWYIDTFCEGEKTRAAEEGINVYDLLNREALDVPAGANGLIFFPYLLGERAPLWNSYARGMFIGASLDTSKTDFTRAVFEGTAYALRHVFETVGMAGARPTSLRITGGGAKSKTWCKIKASVLNMPIQIMDEASGDVPVGDALIVGYKLRIFPDLEEAVKRFVKVKETIYPDPVWVERYNKLYPMYIKMYQNLDQSLLEMKSTLESL